VFASIIIAVIGGIGIGVLAAVRQNTFTDTLGRLFTLIGSSTPQYWSRPGCCCSSCPTALHLLRARALYARSLRSARVYRLPCSMR
jgi:ABC-type dipeptide/oligopeptide/nickel transport system permease component